MDILTREPEALLRRLLQLSSSLHHHLCPKQVLGVRMGLLGGRRLGLEVPQQEKRLLVLVETDGCAADGVAVATNCWVGRRTLRVLDFGKVAATFVDTETRRALRIVPHPEARTRAREYAPAAQDGWQAQLLGYQHMPDDQLLQVQEVILTLSLEKLLSKPGYRVACEGCGEEVINEREVIVGGRTLCRPCAGESYYLPVGD